MSDSAATASAAPPLRLAPHFPFIAKPCAGVAKPFFDCFSKKSVQPEGGVRRWACVVVWGCTALCVGDVVGRGRGWPRVRVTWCPSVGRAQQDPDSAANALAACIALMGPYDECTRKHLQSRKQRVYRAPEAYTGVAQDDE